MAPEGWSLAGVASLHRTGPVAERVREVRVGAWISSTKRPQDIGRRGDVAARVQRHDLCGPCRPIERSGDAEVLFASRYRRRRGARVSTRQRRWHGLASIGARFASRRRVGRRRSLAVGASPVTQAPLAAQGPDPAPARGRARRLARAGPTPCPHWVTGWCRSLQGRMTCAAAIRPGPNRSGLRPLHRRREIVFTRQQLHQDKCEPRNRGRRGQWLPLQQPVPGPNSGRGSHRLPAAVRDGLTCCGDDRSVELRRRLFVRRLAPRACQVVVAAGRTRAFAVVVAHCRSSSVSRSRRYA